MTLPLDQKSTPWVFETYGDVTWTKETQSLVFNTLHIPQFQTGTQLFPVHNLCELDLSVLSHEHFD